MVGITLSPEQIRRAPLEVRRWLQGEIATSLDPELEAAPAAELSHLATCSLEEAEAIYNEIGGALPVVNLFFELGRGGDFVTSNRLVAHRLIDMLRHSRLQTLQQLSVALQTINQAARKLSGDPALLLYLIDQRGYCLVPVDTQRSVAALWEQLVATPDLKAAPSSEHRNDQGGAVVFPTLHGALTPNAAHLAG